MPEGSGTTISQGIQQSDEGWERQRENCYFYFYHYSDTSLIKQR